MTADIRIEKQAGPSDGRYVGKIPGTDGEAEITFTVHSPTLISADHTNAPESMRGTGSALALVEFMIADARRTGFKVVPTCPYVLAQFKKHPEWQDVMGSL